MRRRTKQKIINKLKEQLNVKTERFYPRPAEVKLIQVLGGKTLTIPTIRSQQTGLPMTIVLSRGKILRREHFKRTGDTLILFSNDLKWALALQGREYERDVVAAYERDEELINSGWRIKYIRAYDLWHNPVELRKNLLQFLTY